MKKVFKIVDLFCGCGGCSVGYYRAFKRAGYDVEITGIDLDPQPDYPFEFIQGDAMRWLNSYWHGELSEVDLIHASPPCQAYSTLKKLHGKKYPKLLETVIDLLMDIDAFFVIENVKQAPMIRDCILSGQMFGLKVIRERAFMFGNFFTLTTSKVCKRGTVAGGDLITCVGNLGIKSGNHHKNKPYKYYNNSVIQSWREAMNIFWTKKRKSLAQAIPPAYTDYIGQLLVEYIKAKSRLSEEAGINANQ